MLNALLWKRLFRSSGIGGLFRRNEPEIRDEFLPERWGDLRFFRICGLIPPKIANPLSDRSTRLCITMPQDIADCTSTTATTQADSPQETVDVVCIRCCGWSRIAAPLPAKHFALATICFTTLLLLTVAAINWMVNPYNQYSSNFLVPLIRDSRSEKVALFEQQSPYPEGLILGSSRAMKFEPAYLETRTKLKHFNFGVNHGRPEDFLAIVQLYHQTFRKYPKSVLIGVDVAALNDTVPSDARLSAEPKLYSAVRHELPWTDEFDRFGQLLSYQQFVSSLKSIQRKWMQKGSIQTPEKIEAFDPDGVIQYLKRQTERLEGSYDFAKAIHENEKEMLAVFSGMTSLSTTRLEYLRKTISLCEQNDCQVTLFLTVHHPLLRITLASRTKFLRLEKEAHDALQKLADENRARFVDLSAVENFGGDPDDFVDGIHPLEYNTRKMIDRLYPQHREVQYAVQ